MTDFEKERNLAEINRSIDGIETVLMVTSADVQYVSSSMVRELISFGRPVDDYVIDTFRNLI